MIATDISPRMVTHIESAAKRAGSANIRAVAMDAEFLDVADSSIDAAYCMFGVMLFADRTRAFREVHRVLRPGGRFVTTTWHETSRLLAPVRAAVHAIRPGSPPDAALSAPPVLGTPDALRQELETAGLRDIEVHELERTLEFSSHDVYLDDFPRANPMGIMMQRMLLPPVRAAMRERTDVAPDVRPRITVSLG
ncbi:class I SAM-dependent methyltransferase [Vulcanimicrobium alpinum]